MRRAPIAEEAPLVAIGAQSEIDESADASLLRLEPDEGRQVEHRMGRALGWREEARIGPAAALIVGPSTEGCARAGRRAFPSPSGRADDAAEGALPAGMGGADDTCLAVGEENRPAIGRRNAERDILRDRHHRIRPGFFALPRAGDNGDIG
ncbi:hypothetical protein DdX_22481 [Ditylenchus destructor]|uniref:Uncharacterized protein n=1 Tax=Ditylenchus destructor TaxID=166010 RepID=A0AAD4QUF3_9BILA|nr:hypothetical protein DdX_22481 [Ditylenchus destructor]